MKLIKTTLIAAAMLISCNIFGMFGNLTKNEELLFTAIENGDQTTFDRLLTPSKKPRFDKIFWMLPFLDVYPSYLTDEPIFDDIDINKKTQQTIVNWHLQETPLHAAIHHNKPILVQSLVEKGAKIKNIAIFMLSNLNQPRTLEILLDNGANINVKKKNSYTEETPLHHAYFHTRVSLNHNMVKTFLCNNALLLEDSKGRTPLDYAIDNNNQLLQNTFNEIINYKTEVSTNNTADALDKAITNNGANNSKFSKKEWLILALHNKHHKQIKYCIANKMFEPEYILALLLLNKRLPVDMANALLSTIKNDNVRKKLYAKAKKQNHKKLGQELIKINNISNTLTLKNTGSKKGKLPAEIVNNIISYL